MKKLTMGAMLLGMAVLVAGCTKSGSAAKAPALKEKPAATSAMEHKTTTPAQHTTMKPATRSTTTPNKAKPKNPRLLKSKRNSLKPAKPK